MKINEVLNSLENSWKRDDILLKLKKGLDTDKIVNEFLIDNEIQVKELNSLLRAKDIDLLNQIEQLSTCEAKLINKINNLKYFKNNENLNTTNGKEISFSNKVPANRISLFIINWSNKFVVIVLIIISAIALSKQAWV